MGLAAFEDIGTFALNLPAPRVRDLRILPGLATWQGILENKFHLEFNEARKYASAAFGFLLGALAMLFSYVVWWLARRSHSVAGFGLLYAFAVLALGVVLSPMLNGSAGHRDCDSDVIAANERIGTYLREIIPGGSLVYWDGGYSAAPLLYLPDIDMFPAQINGAYSFIQGGSTAALERFGYWNEEMDAEWKAAADTFIIEESRYAGWKTFFDSATFKEFPPTAVGTSCLEGTRLRIFQRKE
jgi:hypothetical protein